MTKTPSVFACQSCGYSTPKWLGRCPDCGSWNSFIEERKPVDARGTTPLRHEAVKVERLSDVTSEDAPRVETSNAEFNRVLGGGIVPGSLVLLGGEPGVGKSTLLLQIAQSLLRVGRRVLYVSGEESVRQIKMRAERLNQSSAQAVPVSPAAGAEDIYVLAESSLENILAAAGQIKPTDLIIDSVQTTCSEELESTPGSITQVRHVAAQLLRLAKLEQISVFLIGHVTKDGSIAGPKALEHIVDAVLYFEGDRHHSHRIIRAVKNRFGAANEVGIFEMTAAGLIPVRNPSSLFLSESGTTSPGSAVCCAMEGSRPILVELQALVLETQYGTARRTATGIDYNRVSVLVAMIEKRLGIPLMSCDIYLNAAGGLQITEPASDLAIVAAVLSSFRNRAVAPKAVLLGELGLSGEVRPVSQIHVRLREAAAMGFDKSVLPAGNLPLLEPVGQMELLPVRTVQELSDLIFRT
jgi:DNA repair protein RadA/Sms